jgi:hypothetical protein
MIKTLVVYEDGKTDIEQSAKLIAARLDSKRYEVKLRAASVVSIPEILAAKLYFFGADTVRSPSYAEVARVFLGINLAGRSVAYFGPSSEARASLKAMAGDTDLRAACPDLVDARPEPEAVSAWLRNIR